MRVLFPPVWALLAATACGPPPRPSPSAKPTATADAPADELPRSWLVRYPELRKLLPGRDVVVTSESITDRRRLGTGETFAEYGVISTRSPATCFDDLDAAVRSLDGEAETSPKPGWYEARGPAFEVEATRQGDTCQVLLRVPLFGRLDDMEALARSLPGYDTAAAFAGGNAASVVFAQKTTFEGETHAVVELFGTRVGDSATSWLERTGYVKCATGGVLSASVVEYGRKDVPRIARVNARDRIVRFESARATRGAYVGMIWPRGEAAAGAEDACGK